MNIRSQHGGVAVLMVLVTGSLLLLAIGSAWVAARQQLGLAESEVATLVAEAAADSALHVAWSVYGSLPVDSAGFPADPECRMIPTEPALPVPLPEADARVRVFVWRWPELCPPDMTAAAAPTAGGWLGPGAYHVFYTWRNERGETSPAPAVRVEVPAGSQLVVTVPPRPDGASAIIYLADSGGTAAVAVADGQPESDTVLVPAMPVTRNTPPAANGLELDRFGVLAEAQVGGTEQPVAVRHRAAVLRPSALAPSLRQLGNDPWR